VQPERLVVGRIAKAHGIRGEVAIDVISDAPDRFAPGARVYAGERPLTVASSRSHQGRELVLFEEVPDRNAAEMLRGVELTIPFSDAREIDDAWSFYPHQLVGLAVVDEAGTTLGTMQRVDESPGGDLWVVRSDGRDVLVPAVRDIVREVDLENKKIVLHPPDGLF
jgi:16S rRNA processing protein RimM